MSIGRLADHRPDARDLLDRAWMKAWPPKPGLTVISRTRSIRSITYSMALDRRAGIERDAGLLAERADRLQRAMQMRAGLGMDGDDVGSRPWRRPRDRDRPARSSDARRRASSCAAAIAFTTSGPKVMLGTKCPSITSRWIQSAPAASTARTSSPSLAKSAARIDGAMTRGRDANCSDMCASRAVAARGGTAPRNMDQVRGQCGHSRVPDAVQRHLAVNRRAGTQ